ncbi:putative small GTPase, P-loop containing nucleoside triphosphate hydrolase [Helianthus anomalus]
MMSADARRLIALAGGLMNFIVTHCDMNVITILVGNKSDLKDAREVSTTDGKSLAETQSLFFIETSALDSSNVNAAFQTIVKEIYNILCKKVIQSQELKKEPSIGSKKTVVLDPKQDANTEEKKEEPPKKAGCCSY